MHRLGRGIQPGAQASIGELGLGAQRKLEPGGCRADQHAVKAVGQHLVGRDRRSVENLGVAFMEAVPGQLTAWEPPPSRTQSP
jgi:hypothetical protein